MNKLKTDMLKKLSEAENFELATRIRKGIRLQRIMICGQDCHPGGENCNNYCNHKPGEYMPDHPKDATTEMIIRSARRHVSESIQETLLALADHVIVCTTYDCPPEVVAKAEVLLAQCSVLRDSLDKLFGVREE